MSKELTEQCRNAFEFVEKLHYEVSYLIREVEGLLAKEPEQFLICRPSGYAVASYKSVGLEPSSVEYWLMRTATVGFVPADATKSIRGQTVSQLSPSLRVLLLHIEFIHKGLDAPRILAGCLWNVKSKKADWKKFEYFMWEFGYNFDAVFAKSPVVKYEDGYCSFDAKFVEQPLFSIKDSQAVMDKIVAPMLKVYRG